MTQSTPERAPCGTCGNEYTVTAAGGVRHHFTENPDFQSGPDSRKCKGVGQPPAGATQPQTVADGPQCRLCRHPVVLTGNGRARSHLTPEQTPRSCPAGSDFPLGTFPDVIGTTDGLVATLAFDCEHRETGACYDCYGARSEAPDDISHAVPAKTQDTGPSMAEQLRTGAVCAHPQGFAYAGTDENDNDVTECPDCGAPEPAEAVDRVLQPDDDGAPEASRFMELLTAETRGAGTVLDRIDPAVLDRIDPAVLKDRRTPERKAADAETSRLTREAIKVLNHRYTDPSGVVWVHEGPEESCTAPDCALLRNRPDGFDPACEQCDTDTHRCPGCGSTDVPHGTVACAECTARVAAEDAERQAKCWHPDGFNAPLMVDGREVPACGHCNAVAPVAALPMGETDDGRPCGHSDSRFGVEDGKSVCIACGTPCTHPHGFQDWTDDVDEDGQDRVVSTCSICGVVDPEDELSTDDDPQVHLGDLEVGNCFTRKGTLMRVVAMPVGGAVEATVLDGPHKDRTGELNDWGEVVERADDPAETHVVADGSDDPEHVDDWRTPADLLAKMSEEIRGMDALRFNCAECKHPVTPLVDQFSFDGRAAVVSWACEPHITSGYQECRKHECRPDCLVSVGDLEHGDHFVRRGTLMRATSSGYGVVKAEVMDGPHKGRTGELKNPAEQVERVPAPTAEQETTECTDVTTQQQPASPVPDRPTTAPAPGSPRPTTVSAATVAPRSTRVTASVPTEPETGKPKSAVPEVRTTGESSVTTDQDRAAAFLGSGSPAVPAQPGPANTADAAAQFLAGGSGAHGEKETKRDRFGRYLIPHPDTGKEQAWTRATTFAKSISDTYALSQWGLRMALLGATVRPDIVQRAHGKHVKQDKSLLDELTADLKNAAGDKVAANRGTAMHSFTELADRAWNSPGGPRSVMGQIPPDCRDMVETYIRLLEETGLEPVSHLIEFTTVVKQYGVAGTSDNCYKVTRPLVLGIGRAEVRLAPGEYVIGDKKTGKDLSYGWQEIAIQLGTYAQGINTAGVWDRHDEVWHPDPLSRFDKPGTKVRLDAGIVVHLPVDAESEKSPAVYGIDLESGWNAAVLCERVRTWRKVRNLSGPVMVSESPDTFATQRPAAVVVSRTTVRPPSLRDRASAVTSKTEASAVWKEAKENGMPDAEVDTLVKLMQVRLAELAEPGG